MKKGSHYWETYVPVVSWQLICLLLTILDLHNWNTLQLGFALVFPQSPVENYLYMDIPKVLDMSEGNVKYYALKIRCNIYVQKQAVRVWNQHLVEKLIRGINTVQSKHKKSMLYQRKNMYELYTYYSILAGPDKAGIDQIIKDIQEANLGITIEGDLQEFLSVNIEIKSNGVIHLTQPHLMNQILKYLRLEGENLTKNTIPAS